MPLTPPSATARTIPADLSGIMGNGFASKITFSADADIEFLEIEVSEGEVEGGDGIDDTTMFNTSRMTQSAPALWKKENGSALVAYSPATEALCLALINVFGTITITYPDGTTKADYGWMKAFKPGALTINGRPTATVEFAWAGQDTNGYESTPIVA